MSASKDKIRERIITLLRREKYTSAEIAQIVNVTPQVVWGIKSHWSLGKYGDPPKQKKKITEEGQSWTYLILSERGEVYLGATKSLRKRLRAHNSPQNDGFTHGRRWHLLAAKWFSTPREGFTYESTLKHSMTLKKEWKLQCIERALKIVKRHKYSFNPKLWSGSIETF